MSKPWMPFYVADYLADTGHLTTVQHGGYMLLILHYWKRGNLPNDERQLAQIARMTAEEWTAHRDVLADFFADGWRHERIDEELAHAEEVSSKRRSAAELRHINSSANAKQKDTQSQSQSQSQSPSQSDKKEKQEGAIAPPPKSKIKNKKAAHELPSAFVPDWNAASSVNLSRVEAEREFQKFKNHAHQNGRLAVNWQAAWANWCIKAAEFMGKPPPKSVMATGDPAPMQAPAGAPSDEELRKKYGQQHHAVPPETQAAGSDGAGADNATELRREGAEIRPVVRSF